MFFSTARRAILAALGSVRLVLGSAGEVDLGCRGSGFRVAAPGFHSFKVGLDGREDDRKCNARVEASSTISYSLLYFTYIKIE